MAKSYSDTDQAEGTKYANMGKPKVKKSMAPAPRQPTSAEQMEMARLLRAGGDGNPQMPPLPENYYTKAFR